MNSIARQRFAQMMQQETDQPMRPQAPQGQASRMMSAVRMAEGGAVGGLPTLEQMSQPGYQFQMPDLSTNTPPAPFNPFVPMFNLEAPAFGGMEQSTYDFTAPSVMGGQYTQPARQAPATVGFTSNYVPVDATAQTGGTGVPNNPYIDTSVYPTVVPDMTPRLVTAQEQQQRELAAEQARLQAAAGQAAAQQAAAQQAAAQQAAQQAEEQARLQAGIQAELNRQAQAKQDQQAEEERARLQAEEDARQASGGGFGGIGDQVKQAIENPVDPTRQYIIDRFRSEFGLSLDGSVPGPRTDGQVTWQEDTGGEGSFMTTRTGTIEERDRALGRAIDPNEQGA